MLIVLPTGTDAPIYHWPYATVALILLNIALIFVVPPPTSDSDPGDNGELMSVETANFRRFALSLGDGRLHPVQWVTHNFLHLGYGHLVGNLIFLWAFGIVIEGKLGAFKYLLMTVATGTLHGFMVQLMLMRTEMHGGLAGASAIVYGLLAACMVWAPRNELNCTVVILAGFRVLVHHWSPYFTTVAIVYIGGQIFSLVFWGTVGERLMVTELAHLSGAFWGTALALALLKMRLVDCEGWDIFSVWEKRKKLARDWDARGKRLEQEEKSLRRSLKARVKAESVSDENASPEERAASAVRKVQSLFERGDLAGALKVYDKSTRTLVCWPPQPELHAMIKALHAQGAEVESIPLLRDHCRYYPEASVRVRLKLAQILIKNSQRPAAALKVLDEIAAGSLPKDLELARRKLVAQANQMREDGVLELDDDV